MSKFDIHQHVTDGIIKAIEAGTPPWRKPWTGGGHAIQMPTRNTGEAYRGINILWLWLTADEKQYHSKHWFTFKQAKQFKANVRKGEKSTPVIYFKKLKIDKDGKEEIIPMIKHYTVFNADQIDGLPDEFYIKPDPPRDLGTEADPLLDEYVAKTGAKLIVSDDPRAYYDPNDDFIHMPLVNTFHDTRSYYSALFHEIIHWTGHQTRLDRTDIDYAFEELVAEIGACMICTKLNIEPDFPNSATYIENWIKCMKADKKAIFKAASAAQKAMDYIVDLIDID